MVSLQTNPNTGAAHIKTRRICGQITKLTIFPTSLHQEELLVRNGDAWIEKGRGEMWGRVEDTYRPWCYSVFISLLLKQRRLAVYRLRGPAEFGPRSLSSPYFKPHPYETA